jgi:putative drug exporter of the RND superfamily
MVVGIDGWGGGGIASATTWHRGTPSLVTGLRPSRGASSAGLVGLLEASSAAGSVLRRIFVPVLTASGDRGQACLAREGNEAVNALLERLAGFAARKHWVIIIAWLVILGGLLAARHAYGGEYVNNYTVSGSDSAAGIDVVNSTFPQQGGFGGQIVFHARSGTVSAQESAVNQATTNVSKLPNVIKAVSPFSSSGSAAVSKDGTIAYASVAWNVNPDSLDTAYLDKLDNAVAPATKAGLQVEYGAGAGQIGQKTADLKSEIIGLSCALVLLLLMFGSVLAAAIPLVSAIFSVVAGLALLGLLAAAVTFPTTAPTIATLLGLGVAVDYGLFLVARHREQVDSGMDVVPSVRRAAGTSGAAIVVAGCTVAVSVLGLYISGVSFVGSLGLAAALVVVVTMLAALTLVPAFMGLIRENVRALSARFRARKAGLSAQQQAAQTAAATHEQHEHSAFARWGQMVSGRPWPWAVLSVAVLVVLAIPLFSITLGQPDNGTNPTSDSSRRAYDLISQGFGVGVNGPLTVVVKLPKQSSSDNSSLLSTMQSDISKTAGVASVTPAAVNSDGTTAVFNVIPTTRPQSTATTNLVTTLRDTVLPKEHATSYVTGTTAGAVDFTSQITSRLPWLIIAVVAISFLLLTTAFRSVVIATKAAILNILSIGAAYGVIVAIFEWGWGKSLIGL